MEHQVEKLLTVLMHNVIEGIPNGKGGYFEQPVQVEASNYLEQANQIKDAAVSAAARKLLVEEDTWSETIWKNTLVVLVGSIPLVGSSTAFYPQFERLWKQLRFIAASACIYGHDVHEEGTQCQIVLCLVDEKLRNGKLPNTMDGLHTATRVAASSLVRGMAVKGGTTAVLGRALGGVLAGVVPGVVSGVYNVMFGLKTTAEGRAKAAQELVTRVQDHFKLEDHQAMLGVGVWFCVWLLPTVIKILVQIDQVFLSTMAKFLDGQQVSLHLGWRYLIHFSFLAAVCWIVYGLLNIVKKLASAQPWMVSTSILAIRGFLHFASAKSVSGSAMLFVFEKNFYLGHKMFVGAYSILSRQSNDLKPWLPYVQASFLIWVVINLLDLILLTFAGHGLPEQPLKMFHTLQENAHRPSTGDSLFFGAQQLTDALDVVSTLAMISLVDEIRRPEIIVKLLGPRQVVDGLVFAARRLGTMIAKPKEVLDWLDETAPSPTICCVLVAARRCSLMLGFVWGIVVYLEIAKFTELLLASYAVLASVAVVMWQLPLPEPIEHKLWSQALTTRHRLLYLIPDVQPKVLKNLYYALEFFETYEKAMYHTSISILSSREWIGKNWNQVVGRFIPSAVVQVPGQEKEVDTFQVVSHDDVISGPVTNEEEHSIWARSTTLVWSWLPFAKSDPKPVFTSIKAGENILAGTVDDQATEVTKTIETTDTQITELSVEDDSKNVCSIVDDSNNVCSSVVDPPGKLERVVHHLSRVPIVGRFIRRQVTAVQVESNGNDVAVSKTSTVVTKQQVGNETASSNVDQIESTDEDKTSCHVNSLDLDQDDKTSLLVKKTKIDQDDKTSLLVEKDNNKCHETQTPIVSLDDSCTAQSIEQHITTAQTVERQHINTASKDVVQVEKSGWLQSTIRTFVHRKSKDNDLHIANLCWFQYLGGKLENDNGMKMITLVWSSPIESNDGWLAWIARKRKDSDTNGEQSAKKKNAKLAQTGSERSLANEKDQMNNAVNERDQKNNTPNNSTVSLEWFLWAGGKMHVDQQNFLHDSELPPIVIPSKKTPTTPSRTRRSIGWIKSMVSKATGKGESCRIADLTYFRFLGGNVVQDSGLIDIWSSQPHQDGESSLQAWANWVSRRGSQPGGEVQLSNPEPSIVTDLRWFEWLGGTVLHDNGSCIDLRNSVHFAAEARTGKRQAVLNWLEKIVLRRESSAHESLDVLDKSIFGVEPESPDTAAATRKSAATSKVQQQFQNIADLRYFVALNGNIAPPPMNLVNCRTHEERQEALKSWFVKLDTHPEKIAERSSVYHSGYRTLIKQGLRMLPIPPIFQGRESINR